jgi:copper oxidase (laccase) domain-containing protein
MTQPLHAHTLDELPGIRHAFFTRAGGVSGGIYASLNAGVGSNDDQGHVAENRVRMATTLGVAPERFLTCYQIHSPDVVVAAEPRRMRAGAARWAASPTRPSPPWRSWGRRGSGSWPCSVR